jgi:saccharopine dehydrogenase-like NADP-dependent oxidoreductase
MRTVVVLGGYGNFGRRIVHALAGDGAYRVIVAGRNATKAQTIAREVGAHGIAIDTAAEELPEILRSLGADLLIHTAGPFQNQSYAVARACIDTGTHYIDLADGRAYVCGIRELDAQAQANAVLIVSGASSLPALSSAVVDRFSPQFSRMQELDVGISSGARPPGRATMDGVLAYVGRPFTQWCDGSWKTVHGWQDMRSQSYPRPVGTRWIANCDVPDLQLFPQRYATLERVTFRAGVGPKYSMLGLWIGSWLVRAGILRTLVPYVPRLHRTALALAPFGSRCSAMHVTIRGLDHNNVARSRSWYLIAENDHGPDIPCFPAIALARKILRGEIHSPGAMPCMGLLTLDEILGVGRDLYLRTEESEHELI